ncbi:MAG: S9 family peptidase [Candidatus Pseudobacter hemicellulosilyticus]|uniref:Proline-specific endopeptidase n=1 Tax=Candidatus Pseudobacter hemicellulosilyticus TaxID=3121375 RepID=A0AAJ6BGC4_9BACT|nr:MAG: S9 family peptidase [Pseudobacter sp.]
MKFNGKIYCAVLLLAGCQQTPSTMNKWQWPSAVPTPTVDKIDKAFTMHGDTRHDEYYWLNERNNPKVLDYLRAENAYLDTMLAGAKDFREKLFTEMKGRIKEKDESLPYKDNDYWYYVRFEEGKQYPIFCRKKGSLDAAEEVMLDQNLLAEGHKYLQVGGRVVSDNNELLAYTSDTVSRRLYDLRFRNLRTGESFPESIPNVDGNSVAWAADNKTIFYIKKDVTTLLPFQVWRHVLGTDPARDLLLYEEKDNRFSIGLGRSKSKKYIHIEAEMNEVSTETRLLEASKPDGQFQVFLPRQVNFQYYVEHFNDKFYVRTDWEAPNFRLMETPEGKTGKENWKEVLPHRKDAYLADMTVFKNFLVLSEVKDALRQLRVINQTTQKDEYLKFDEPAYTVYAGVNPDFNTDTLRFVYTSLTTPASIYDYNMTTKARELKKQTEVLGGFKKEDYASERIWATARDGVKVPVSILYKKGVKRDGKNPLLLYAYGSYGASSFPGFNSNIFSLINRGFVFAVAHVRGGQELGRQWYDDGHLFKKKNTFYDFIDCGEFLVKEQFTSKEHLYALGGSAGGLLMGAVVNMRPDLFKGVIAEVPFVDVITTMSDPSIPLTTGEYKEWGNPADSAEYFYIKGYSPYDNVEAKPYPNLLVTTGLHDSQVQYFEPAKWVARLRERKQGDGIILFSINMDAGHGGASGRFDYLKDEALQYAFLLVQEGITE